ncbi:MAG: copper chaperone PCu(A)C [Mesorhizobium sp.]
MFHFSLPGARAVISRKLCLAVLSAGFLAAASQSVFAHEFKVGDLEIEHPWSRETPTGARVAGGYFTVTNNGTSPDRLVSVTSEVSAKAEVHQMAVSDGVMTMRRVDGGLEIPAGGTVALESGGYHLMFIDLKRQPRKGESFPATLTFEKAGSVTVDFAVEGLGGSGADAHGSHAD